MKIIFKANKMVKQGEKNFKFVKEKHNQTQEYIFQKNTNTKSGVKVFIVVHMAIVVAMVLSGIALEALKIVSRILFIIL